MREKREEQKRRDLRDVCERCCVNDNIVGYGPELNRIYPILMFIFSIHLLPSHLLFKENFQIPLYDNSTFYTHIHNTYTIQYTATHTKNICFEGERNRKSIQNYSKVSNNKQVKVLIRES